MCVQLNRVESIHFCPNTRILSRDRDHLRVGNLWHHPFLVILVEGIVFKFPHSPFSSVCVYHIVHIVQIVYINLQYRSVCPLVRIGTPPHPLSQTEASVPPPPEPKGGGHTRLLVRG